TYKYYAENAVLHYDMGRYAPSQLVHLPKCKFEDKYAARTYNVTHYTFPEIPSSIIRWFQCNVHIQDKRIEGIPFGVNDANVDVLRETIEWARDKPKMKGSVYVNFDVNSNPPHRAPLLQKFLAERY